MFTGSPPPMRGKVFRYAGEYSFYRITPAYAGKSITSNPFTAHGKDHPRLCGEKCFKVGGGMCFKGSPPPMRGKAQKTPCGFPRGGITPAYAGKSLKRAKLRDVD